VRIISDYCKGLEILDMKADQKKHRRDKITLDYDKPDCFTVIPAVPEPKESFVHELVEYIVSLGDVLFDGSYLLKYSEEFGMYDSMRTPEQELDLVYDYLEEDECAKLSSSMAKEIVFRLKRQKKIRTGREKFNAMGDRFVNCLNGVFDTVKRKLKPHDRKYGFTYCNRAVYIEDHKELKYPAFTNFCETSLEGDPEKKQLMLELVGHTVVPGSNTKKAGILAGNKDCGKSKVMGTIITVIVGPDELSAIPLHALNERFSNWQLATARVNMHTEMDISTRINSLAGFKAITGSDLVKGEGKNKPLFSFRHSCKLLFAGNALPPVKDIKDLEIFLDRLVVLTFNKSIPREEWDHDLEDKIAGEIDSIYTLAMNAYADLKERGYEFTQPKDSRKFLNQYRAEANTVKLFVEDWCDTGKEYRQFSSVLFDKYTEFCRHNLYTPVAKNQFSIQLGKVLGTTSTTIRMKGSKPGKGFKGITCK
jgi:putative DNA primase/helicase